MSDEQTPPRKPARDYKVGYAKPPQHTRFRKGQSGNPKGRPRGSVSFASLLEKILGEKAVIVESGRRRRMANREVMMRQLIKKAVLGDLRCMRLILDAHQAPEPVTTVDGNATKEWLEDINIEDLSDKQLADLIKRLRLTVDAMSPKT